MEEKTYRLEAIELIPGDIISLTDGPAWEKVKTVGRVSGMIRGRSKAFNMEAMLINGDILVPVDETIIVKAGGENE